MPVRPWSGAWWPRVAAGRVSSAGLVRFAGASVFRVPAGERLRSGEGDLPQRRGIRVQFGRCGFMLGFRLVVRGSPGHHMWCPVPPATYAGCGLITACQQKEKTASDTAGFP